MASITLRSYQQILGNMIATLLAQTDLNDLSPGSVLLTILEAAASSDFTQEGKLLQLLNLRDVDQASGVDLENLASELGVVPSREGARSANTQVSVGDSAFTKISSNVYAGTISPIAGDTTINLVNAGEFNSSGTIYVGRGTPTFESVAYVSIVNNTLYYTLNLSSPLTKDHLVGEEVVLAQGGDRAVDAGTLAQVPSLAGQPPIQYSTTIDVTIPDGENVLQGVTATAVLPGSAGNVGINMISQFVSPPFSTATVVNDQFTASGGIDTETDSQLRQRIKDWVHNLGRGTEQAIVTTVVGVSDPVQNNIVVSAYLREPTETGQLAILFIDDGTGFEPTFSGVGVESVVSSAAGTEEYLQLQNFPVVKSQLASVATEPFKLVGGERLSFSVDGMTEERSLPNIQYRTPGIVLAQEIAQTINAVFSTVEARAKEGQLFVTPVADEPGYIQSLPASTNDGNAIVQFPNHKQFTLRLYQDNVLLNKNGADATIQSFPNTQWPPFSSPQTLQLTIDGIISPVVTVTDAIFASLTTSVTIAGATGSDWATVLNAVFIGITATALSDGTVSISSNRGEVSSASVSVFGGSLAGTLISASASATGTASQYALNRLLGQIKLVDRLSEGDNLSAGTNSTEGFVLTSNFAVFNLPAVLGSPAMVPIVVDSTGVTLPVNQTVSPLTFSTTANGIQRITGAVGQFSAVLPNDWGFFYNLPITGFAHVFDVATDGSYVDCFYGNPISGSATPDGISIQFCFFRTIGFPQLLTLPVGSTVPGSSVINAVNTQIVGAFAEVENSNIIQIQTQRLAAAGGLFIPFLFGSGLNLGFSAGSYASNDPQLATEESADLAGYPSGKLTIATPDTSAPYDTLNVNGTPFTSKSANNRPVLPYLGSSSGVIREPLEVISTSQLTLRENPPLQVDPIGFDMHAVTTSGMEFGQADNLVVIMDDNPNEETFDIPMYVNATVSAPSVPTTTQFDATDSTGALLGSSSRWLLYPFEDYRIWFKARRDLPQNVANSSIRIVSSQFGPNGANVQFGIFYPSVASASPLALYSLDGINGLINMNLVLGSSAPRAVGLSASVPVVLSQTGTAWQLQFVPPVDLTSVVAGDVVSLTDPNFNSANINQFVVQTISNLSDVTRSYQFLAESLSANTVSGGTSFTLGSTPAQALSPGDKITINSITRASSGIAANQITVPTGSAYATGGGSLSILSSPYTYTSYNAGTGIFSGVLPDPNGVITPGIPITQALTAQTLTVATVATATTGTFLAAYGLNGSGFDMVLTHKALTANAAPSFTVAAGDLIQVESQLLTVESVVSTTIFTVNSPFSFSGSSVGTVSRIFVAGTTPFTLVPQTIDLASSSGVTIFPLSAGSNSASNLISIVNNTAGVNAIVVASNSPGSNGSGVVTTSTGDLLGNGSPRVSLLNSESFILATASTSPALTLKFASDVVPEIGESIRLVPMTPLNIKNHLNKLQISGLSIVSDIDLVDGARHVQITSKTPGEVGQVYAVGGTGAGYNQLPVQGPGTTLTNGVGQLQLSQSAVDFLNPGHLIHISQSGPAKKNFVAASPISTTTAQIQIVNPTTAQLTFGVPLTQPYTYTHSGSVVWAVTQLSRGRLRFEILSGAASLPGSLQMDDWVLVGNGTSYAGITPTSFFAGSNTGYLQIRETDSSTYFDVDAPGFNQFVTCTSSPMVFFPYFGVRIGDQLVIGNGSPFVTANQGTFLVTAVLDNHNIQYTNSSASNQGPFELGSGGVGSITINDQGYSTYRTVTCVVPDPSDPTDFALVTMTPGYNISLFNPGQDAAVSLPNRLNFPNNPVPGISGYQFWTGLKRTVQRTVDGYSPDPVTYPGVRAAGVAIEVREPQLQDVSLSIQIATNQGVALSSIADTVTSSVIGFINSLGLGQSVVLSEIVSIIQGISGVNSVILVNPSLDQGEITVSDNAIARTSTSLITIS